MAPILVSLGNPPYGRHGATGAESQMTTGGWERYPESFHYDLSSSVLHVGEGEFGPVSSATYDFEVSGLKVVQSWLAYRMKSGKGRKSSPLDDIRPRTWTPTFTSELLELLWMLEQTLESYPKQEQLLDQITSGPCFLDDEFPDVPPEARRAPRTPSRNASKQRRIT